MALVNNPILRGFNPDPSIIRVGDDYFIATSTFEWFPGVQIHHSKDLVNWELVCRPLNRVSQLDMLGVADSCGVWAPCLSYDQETFYLVFSNVKNFKGIWKDTPNYLVTTKDVYGDWSEPTFLSASGFDGSLFHDDDGRKWYLSMLMDHRNNKFFGGIILQEFGQDKMALTGPVHHIFDGTTLGKTEGPHLYKRNGYYYLLTAEGGTEYGHAVTIARSRNILGPYEVHPDNPVISSAADPTWPIQKTGHGDLVETNSSEWYAVFLGSRPLSELGRCTLGRETCLQPVIWDQDWLYTKNKQPLVQLQIPMNGVDVSASKRLYKEDFDDHHLPIDFQTLRVPFSEHLGNLNERRGFLRLFGRNSLSSVHNQSLVARRVQHFNIEASTYMEFEPVVFQQMAGLVCYYNTSHYHYIYLTANESSEKILNIITCDKNAFKESNLNIEIDAKGIFLKAHFHREQIQFYYGTERDQWIKVGPVLDGSILSDDYVQDKDNDYMPAFTGAFVGICCQDLTGSGLHADFDWFEYKELE